MRPLKRSFAIRGHRTSISLEAPFWEALKEIADDRAISLAALVAEIDAQRAAAGDAGLSTAVRVFVLETLRARLREESGGGSRAP